MEYSLLPDLAPRDSHSLWYTSSRNPLSSSLVHDAHFNSLPPQLQQQHEQGHRHQSQPHGINHNNNNNNNNQQSNQHRRRAEYIIERSSLARLRDDEQNIERRRQNVIDYGAAWLKPPGLPKTLHQLREERREAEEHQEALRREQLAQELAEAEAEAAARAAVGDPAELDAILDALPLGVDDDDGMDDVQLDGTRDLDDDIPEADGADFDLSDDEDDSEEEEEDDDDDDEEDDDDEDEEEDEDEDDDEEMRAAQAQAQQQQLMAQRMRQANDAFREDMVRGRDSAAFYGGDEDVDDEDQSQILEEEDLVGAHAHAVMDDMGMGADLDDEIPEAESMMGGYEHTDTEAELSSSMMEEEDEEEEQHEHIHNSSHVSFVASSSLSSQQQQASRFRPSFDRGDGHHRSSLAISDILSRDGSSVLGSSPAVPRQRGVLSARRGRG